MRTAPLLLLASLISAGEAKVPGPEAHHPMVAGLVMAGLDAYHYAPHPLDDELSACWHGRYLDRLDPDHSVFLAADVAEFGKWRTRLDDLQRGMAPDLDPAWVMFERYQERQGERVAWMRANIGSPVDFTVQEGIARDPTELPRPVDVTEQHERWRKQIKHQRLQLVLDGEDDATIEERLTSRLDRLQASLDEVESADVLESWLSALTGCLDPHTDYFRPASADDFQIATSGTLEGIGAALVRDGDYVRITEIIAGGPADRSGELVREDRIVGVAQGEDAFTDVIGMRLDKVVQLIRGPKGTTVRLEILPAGVPGSGERRIIRLVRDRIDLESVEPTGTVHELGEGAEARRLLVLDVPAFAADPQGRGRPSTSEAVRTLIEDNAGVDGVLIDLRENGGGYLDEAIKMAGLFIDRGPVVQVREANGRIKVYDDEDRGLAWDGPIVVLTSPITASASEILAGALQDYGAGVVVGSGTTYGKGSVQSVVPLDALLAQVSGTVPSKPMAGMMKVTGAVYYRVDGRSPQATGVPADIVLPSPLEGRVQREREAPNALPPDTIRKARYTPRANLSKVVPWLRDRSTARVQDDPRIDAIQTYLTWLAAEDAKDELSLNKAEREAGRAAAQAQADALDAALGIPPRDESEGEGEGEGEGEQPEPVDPVLEEALKILEDLASLSTP